MRGPLFRYFTMIKEIPFHDWGKTVFFLRNERQVRPKNRERQAEADRSTNRNRQKQRLGRRKTCGEVRFILHQLLSHQQIQGYAIFVHNLGAEFSSATVPRVIQRSLCCNLSVSRLTGRIQINKSCKIVRINFENTFVALLRISSRRIELDSPCRSVFYAI